MEMAAIEKIKSEREEDTDPIPCEKLRKKVYNILMAIPQPEREEILAQYAERYGWHV